MVDSIVMDPEEADYGVQVWLYWLPNSMEYRLISVLVVSIVQDMYVSEKELKLVFLLSVRIAATYLRFVFSGSRK
jgi:hypothetical protein